MRRLAIVLAVVVPGVAAAQSKLKSPMKMEAEKHFNRGLEAYQREDWATAATELSQSWKIEPRVEVLFAWAQAERLAGHCDKAIELYHQLRKEVLPEKDKLAVLEGLERCGAFDRPAPAPAPVKATPPPPSPWYADWLGDTFLVTGLVGLGVGTSFLFVSSSERDEAAAATNYDGHVVFEERARKSRFVAIAAFAAGGALIAGAITRYVLHGADAEPTPSMSAWVDEGATGLVVGGRF